MIDAIVQWHGLEMERVDPLQAAHVVTVLVREAPALMMGINATVGAEIMFGHLRVELIEPKRLVALQYFDSRKRNRRDDCSFSATDRAVTAARVDDAVWKVEFQDDAAAMAREPMLWQDGDATHGLDH